MEWSLVNNIYLGIRFKYQNLGIYDSNCRLCDGIVSNQEIKVKKFFKIKMF